MKRTMKIITLTGLLFLTTADSGATPAIVSGGPANDYEAWIERLHDGRLMIVFDRNPDWASGDLYVAFSSDDGNSWTEEVGIITEPGDQATLSFVQYDSDLLRVWYASNEEGSYRIYSASSVDGLSWTQEGEANLGWPDQVQYYDPTVVLEPDGSLTMSYIVSGDGVYVAHCPPAGSWDTDRVQINNSGFRARIVKHSNGTYLCAYHRRTGGPYDYDIFVRQSDDLENWSGEIRLTSNLNSHDPFTGVMPDGAYLVYYAKYTSPAYNLWYRRSYDGVNWETEEQITADATNNTQPHFLVDAGSIYLVWAHAVSYPSDHDVYFERFSYGPEPVVDLQIELSGADALLLWSYDQPATFKVYWSEEPFGPFDNLQATTTATSLQLDDIIQWGERFYIVTVVD
ncbi:MAG: exo-alpha-sialidase [Candidatus Delongbacteria bacterium]|nr:exo-alpha-sialidase [Candidatus Delongbacteria bacterium]